MNFYKKIVAFITLFFGGTSGILLVSGAGLPALRLAAFFIFFLSVINLSIYLREFIVWFKLSCSNAKKHLADAKKARDAKIAEKVAQESKIQNKAKAKPKPTKAKAIKMAPLQEPSITYFEDDDFEDDDFDLDDDFDFSNENDE